MNNKLLIWFKNLAEGWKIGTVLVGAVITISLVAVKIDHWKDKGLDQANVIEYLKKSDHNQDLYNRMKDSSDYIKWQNLNKRLDGISDTVKRIENKQIMTINSVDALAGKVAKNVEEYKIFMNGLQFELVQSEVMKSVFPETKIRIIKKDSIKK